MYTPDELEYVGRPYMYYAKRAVQTRPLVTALVRKILAEHGIALTKKQWQKIQNDSLLLSYMNGMDVPPAHPINVE